MPYPYKNNIKLSFTLRGYDIPEEFAKAIHTHCQLGQIRPSLDTDRQTSNCGRTIRDTQNITLEFENFAKVYDFITDIDVMANLLVIDSNYI